MYQVNSCYISHLVSHLLQQPIYILVYTGLSFFNYKYILYGNNVFAILYTTCNMYELQNAVRVYMTYNEHDIPARKKNTETKEIYSSIILQKPTASAQKV